MVITTCAELHFLCYGRNIHGLASKLGLFAGNTAIGSSFVYMYSKCAQMDYACIIFDEISRRDVVAWTALIIGYVQNDESEKGLKCLHKMHKVGDSAEKPNFRTLQGGLQACVNMGALLEGKCLHGLILKSGIGLSQIVQSSLLSLYSKFGTPSEAHVSFCEVSNKDLISWTEIISVYSRFGFMDKCLVMFLEMQVSKIDPDEIVISCMILGFGNFMCVSKGKAFHGFIIRRNYVFDHMTRDALLAMYCKFGQLNIAEKLFNRGNLWASESWNMMVFGYGNVGLNAKCIEQFREMQHRGIEAESNCFTAVISSCSQLEETCVGRSLHCFATKSLIVDDLSIANSLIHMYGKFKNLAATWKIFCRMAKKDIVTWNTMMSSYIYNGQSSEALALFHKMTSQDLKANSATFVTALSACSHLASLENGERIHNYIKEQNFEINLSLCTALIHMYAKCGEIKKSREIFNSMKVNERDVISWNAMISGYGLHGDVESALEVFKQMEKADVLPNKLTFLAVLSACSHAGLVKEGKYLFGRMEKYSVRPTLKHYACMVDLLGRSGNLQEAEDLVLSMPMDPDGRIWGALLSACKIHNEIDMGIRVAKRAIGFDPTNDGYYMILSTMYSSIGRWEEAERVRGMMKERGVSKTTGWSSL